MLILEKYMVKECLPEDMKGTENRERLGNMNRNTESKGNL